MKITCQNMNVRLGRIWNVFHPWTFIKALFYLFCAAFVSFPVLGDVFADPLSSSFLKIAVLGVTIAVFLFFFGVFLLDVCFFCAKTLLVDEGVFRFTIRQWTPREGLFRVRGNFIGYLKVEYSVSQIREFTFHQNALERFFDVGHIKFRGRATVTAKREVRDCYIRDRFAIYGIPSFSKFKQGIKISAYDE